MESKAGFFLCGSFDKNLDSLQIAELQPRILGRLAMAIRLIPDTVTNLWWMDGFSWFFDTKVTGEVPHWEENHQPPWFAKIGNGNPTFIPFPWVSVCVLF